MKSFDRFLHGHFIYPSVVRAMGERHLFQRLAELRQLEWSSAITLVSHQSERLAALLRYASEHSPHYERAWGRRLDPSPETAHEQLRSLPFVTKHDLQQNFSEMLAQPAIVPATQKVTGGSTGQAVTVVKDRRATACERAAMWLGYGWRGVHIGDRAARFWGSPFATRRRWLTKASDWAMHRIRFSAFAFGDADLEQYWMECVRFRPDYFHGYVSMLEAFARFVQNQDYDARRLQLKAVIATSEVLTPPQRLLLEEVFGAPVLVEYGCGELGPIAYDCEMGSLHILSPDVVVEILTSDGTPVESGDSGEIVVTDLNNRAMPLVRYRLGDFGIPGVECKCGRGLPTLERIWGRAYDFVGTPDGKRYHGEFFMYLFEDLRRAGAGVQAFQVTQSGPATVQIAVVTPGPLEAWHEAEIHKLLNQRLPGIDARIERVDTIQRTASGKMQLIRNTWVTRNEPLQTGV